VKFLRRIFFNLLGMGVFYFLCHSALVADAVPRDSILIDALLSTGPSGALRGWEARTYGVLEDDIDFEPFENDEENSLFVGYLSLPLENIWTACNITPPKEDEPVSKWILDQINGANDTCGSLPPKLILVDNVQAPNALTLAGSTSTPKPVSNYYYFSLRTRSPHADWQRFPVFLTNLLKGKLRRNPTIAQPFFAATSHLVNADALGPFIGDLFALTAHTAPAFDGWERTASYCFACLTKFLEEHLWVWWLEERVMSVFPILIVIFAVFGFVLIGYAYVQAGGRLRKIAGLSNLLALLLLEADERTLAGTAGTAARRLTNRATRTRRMYV
jgi:hypothetical protein